VVLFLLSGGIFILYALFWLIIILLAVIIIGLIVFKLYRIFYRIFTGKDYPNDSLYKEVREFPDNINTINTLEDNGTGDGSPGHSLYPDDVITLEDYNKYFYKELKLIYR
jgi:hypothetical protein